ncbi:MAG: AAA family ATPase [Burkholderiales bacterium]|nr:AAA family ATPase [Anaerolineae bacterium]
MSLDKLKSALTEVMASPSMFSAETYTQIVLTLNEKIRRLQTQGDDLLALDANADQIRLVTVMFVDVIDSTAIARRLGTDDWKTLIGDVHSHLAHVVETWEGEVGQYLGDGVLCFFGAQRSRGNDAERCVACAMAIQQMLKTYAPQVAGLFGIDLGLRIGISTGRVVVGMIGTVKKGEMLALGPTTNLAARLQAQCPPGEVVIDAETYRRVRDQFLIQSMPPELLKGYDTPVEFFMVLRHRPPTPTPSAQLATRQIAGIELPFVGRETELIGLAQMVAAVAAASKVTDAAGGHWFQAVMIYGDVGMGKSRLLQETLINAAESGMSQVIMAGKYEKRATSYSLLRGLLAARCNLTDGIPVALVEVRITELVRSTWLQAQTAEDERGGSTEVEVAKDTELIDNLSAVIGYMAGYGFEDSPYVQAIQHAGSGQRHLALSAVARWFRLLAQEKPLLIAVDDLQWADNSSLEMLQYLAQDMAEHRGGLLIGTARPEFRDQRRSFMAGSGTAAMPLGGDTTITLGQLEPEATSALLRAILAHVDDAPVSLIDLIKERAGGNPLFVEEFLRMLFDTGVFVPSPRDNGRHKVNLYAYATMTSELPTGLTGILQARLDDLPGAARHVAQIAAVIGQTFWEGAVNELAEFDTAVTLGDLESRGIIIANAESSFEPEREFRFRLTVYREVAYDMLTRTNREALHRRAATWLEARIATRPDYLDELAEHLQRGQENEQALAAYLAAAEDRARHGMYAETLKLIDQGLGAARGVPRNVALPIVSRLWTLQAQTLTALDRYREASAAGKTALMLMDELPADQLVEQRVIAARALGDAYRSLGVYDSALSALEQARALAPAENDPQFAATLRAFGQLYWSVGRLDDSLVHTQRALKLAQYSSDERQVVSARSMLAQIALDRGDLAKALDYLDQVLEADHRAGNTFYQVKDLRMIGEAQFYAFAFEQALETFNSAVALQAVAHYYAPMLQTDRALCLIALGEHEEGITILRDVEARKHENASTRAHIRWAMIRGLADCGDFELCYEKALAFTDEMRDKNPLLFGRGLMWLGVTQSALGKSDAEATLKEALHLSTVYGGRDVWFAHYALGRTTKNAAFAEESFCHASTMLRQRAAALMSRPLLQQAILTSEYAQLPCEK